ncbi:hypothetical protein HA402_003394 [Bradysia odoriphaga]|nr:hypothetical protein HA402_003394 [Bradysia odoriphaga]
MEKDVADQDFQQDWDREDSEDETGRCTPPELIAAAAAAMLQTLPEKSKKRYDREYHDFAQWKKDNKANSNSERVLLARFTKLGEKYAPTTLWAKFSMLKATLKLYDDVDIGNYMKLCAWLKKKSAHYVANKAAVFEPQEIRRFFNEAPDELWLDVKVVCLTALSGACRTHELPAITVADMKPHDGIYLVTCLDTKTKDKRTFTISGPFVSYIDKYAALRPVNCKEERFFLNYQRGKCTVQPIGKNKFYDMPRKIAEYLRLNDPATYTGHSFRRSAASFQANAGATIDDLKRTCIWKSTRVAEQYVVDSLAFKKKNGERITSAINCSEASVSNGKTRKRSATNYDITTSVPKKHCSSTVTSSMCSAVEVNDPGVEPNESSKRNKSSLVYPKKNQSIVSANVFVGGAIPKLKLMQSANSVMSLIDHVSNSSTGVTDLSHSMDGRTGSSGHTFIQNSKSSNGVTDLLHSMDGRTGSSGQTFVQNSIDGRTGSSGQTFIQKDVGGDTMNKHGANGEDSEDDYSSLAGLTQTWTENDDWSSPIANDEDYSSLAGLTQTLAENDDDDYTSLAGLTQTLGENGKESSCWSTVRYSPNVAEKKDTEKIKSKKASGGDDEDGMGVCEVAQIVEKTSNEISSAGNFQDLFQKTFSFHNCANLTINFK